MTRQELMRAFEMRMDGVPFDKIAKEMHYSCSCIMRALDAVIHNEGGWNRTMRKVVYPAIVDYMVANDLSIATLYRTAYGKAGSPPWFFYSQLYGESCVTDRVALKLTELMKLSYKEVFRRDAT